ncbi:hypothetical protein RJT34_29339 [Clitoria ternatea]|uniref:F-box domain-containing protein n=1 Tax=Clitoria ternatea TaxID=43366 RepID=A0AAN9IHI2_CLITE
MQNMVLNSKSTLSEWPVRGEWERGRKMKREMWGTCNIMDSDDSDYSSSSSNYVVPHSIHVNEPSKRQKSNLGLDIISNLPDFIIGHILSFLPTKTAVGTSVLSKKWIFMWTFITKLQLKDREPHQFRKRIKKTCFSNFVNRVLLHLNASSIQSFSLSISENYDTSQVNEWISAILSRRVKKLCVDFCSWKKLGFCSHSRELDLSSHSLLSSQSLVELVLMMYDCVIKIPTFAYLSSLTILKFSGITLTCHTSNKSEKLNLFFPVLRELEMKRCTWLRVKGVTLEVPLLQVVSIDNSRLKPLSDGSYTEIKFCARCFTKFTYVGYMLSDNIFLDLSETNVASAVIDLHKFKVEREEETGILACKLLKQFSNNVKCLKFQRSEVFIKAKDYFVDLPHFENLSRLELNIVAAEILLDLLRKTPLLRTLVFMGLLQFDKEVLDSAIVPDCFACTLQVVNFGGFHGYEHEGKNKVKNKLQLISANVPNCFVTSFQVIEFRSFNGYEHELHFAKFTMENA